MKYFAKILLVTSIIISLCGCTNRTNVREYKSTEIAMGTIVQININTQSEQEDILQDIINCIELLEKDILSWRIESAELAKINHDLQLEETKIISDQMKEYFTTIFEVSTKSEGAFDITIGDVVRLWNIDELAALDLQDKELVIPTETEIQKALQDTGFEQVILEGNVLSMPAQMNLDLGAVGKGIACDEIIKLVEENKEITSALLSVGGSIATYGTKPDLTPWRVAVVNPLDPSTYFGYVTLEGNWNVSTSGDYQRYIMKDGVRYHHIIDPKSGFPVNNGVRSVTIVGKNGLLCDALSTACFVLGSEKGMDLAKEFQVEALFIQDNGTYLMTEGMKQMITIQ